MYRRSQWWVTLSAKPERIFDMTTIEWVYKNWVRPRLFARSEHDAEVAHELTVRQLKRLHGSEIVRSLVGRMFTYRPEALGINAFRVHFPSPLGLAPGFDKGAELYPLMPLFGWGSVEIGGITPAKQDGNPRPRLQRNEELRALWNSMGFNNPGASTVRDRMEGWRRKWGYYSKIPVGLNVGKGKDTPLERAYEDYVHVVGALGEFVDFITINPSSPNTHGLRKLQHEDRLRELIRCVKAKVVRSAWFQKPAIGVKIAPDVTDEQLEQILAVCADEGVNFVVIANTTTDRSRCYGWDISAEGGVSGGPLADPSFDLLVKAYKLLPKTIPIISVGGIFNGADVYERIRHGAVHCQAYTAWPFEGPDWSKRCCIEVEQLMRRGGFNNLTQVIGSAYK